MRKFSCKKYLTRHVYLIQACIRNVRETNTEDTVYHYSQTVSTWISRKSSSAMAICFAKDFT